MRIAVLSWESLHSIAIGGVASHVTELAAALARHGQEVHVFTRQARGQRYHDLVDGVHYHRCPYPSHPEFVDDINNMCRAFVERLFVVEDSAGPFDVVHAHDWLAANAMIWIKQGRARKTVLTIHATEYARCGNRFHGGRSQRIRDQERAATYWADRVISVSKAVKDEIMWMYEVPDWKTFVVYNGVSAHRFDLPVDPGEVKRRYAIGPLDPTVLFCGRLEWQKGPDILMEAIPSTLRAQPTAKFVFMGEGGMRQQLENRARQLGVAGAVRFLGFHSGDELIRLFKMADAVCIPSRNEPFGIVVLEAWSARKPVVVTQIGGPNEYVWHEVNGLKIFPQPTSVAWGLATIFKDFSRARWMGENGRRAVEDRFTWDLVAEKTLAIYDPDWAKSVAPQSAVQEAEPEPVLYAALPEPAAEVARAEMAQAHGDARVGEAPQPARAADGGVATQPAGADDGPGRALQPAGADDGAGGVPAEICARLSLRSRGPAASVAESFIACKRILGRSGLRVRQRGRNLTIQGSWNDVSDAVGRCYVLVERMGEAWITTSISAVSQGDDLGAAKLHIPSAVQGLAEDAIGMFRAARTSTGELASGPVG